MCGACRRVGGKDDILQNNFVDVIKMSEKTRLQKPFRSISAKSQITAILCCSSI